MARRVDKKEALVDFQRRIVDRPVSGRGSLCGDGEGNLDGEWGLRGMGGSGLASFKLVDD